MAGRVTKNCLKLYEKARETPGGLRFTELQTLCEGIGMRLDRVKGSHFIYRNGEPFFLLSVQKTADGKAKAYQVRELLDIIEDNGLAEAG
jgi:hypothetical protein